MEEFLENIYESTKKRNRFFYRFSIQCWPFSPNCTEHNSKNDGKKTIILWPYYGTKSETIFCFLLYVCILRSLPYNHDY